MDERGKRFLFRLLETPSPSGYEAPVQEIVRAWAKEYADEVTTDVHGNVLAVLNPKGRPRVMLAGHCDQIGLMVRHIDDDGFLYIGSIGGCDTMVLLGQPVIVWTDQGPVNGVISRKPTHLLRDEERKKAPELRELWVDIGVRGKAEAERVVRVGDPITFKLEVREMRNGFINAPGIDDKVGAWVVMETLRLVAERGGTLRIALYVVSTVQEEVGLRGATTSAFGIDPHIGIAVDVTHASDHPAVDKREVGDIRMGKGPVIYRGPNINPIVFKKLVAAAEEEGISYQIAGSPRATPTDANVIQITRSGVATGLVSIPNRYMHTPVEMASLNDLSDAAKLLTAFVTRLNPDDDFTP